MQDQENEARLADAQLHYHHARLRMRAALEDIGSVICSMENRIIDLTESLIELDKAKEDKP